MPFNSVCQTTPPFLAYEEVEFGSFDFASISSLWRFYTGYVKLRLMHDLRNRAGYNSLIVAAQLSESSIPETGRYQRITVLLDTRQPPRCQYK